MRGVTGPREVFEGNKGFMEAIAGPFEIDWAREDLESVRRTILKRYNAEIHSQSAIEALLELRAEHGLTGAEVERIELDIFQVAYDIIGGGEEGDKTAHQLQGGGRPLAAVPARGRAARRPGAARAVPARSGSPPTTCKSCCAASRSAPTPSSRGASRRSTAPACGCICATDACSSASSTTTRAFTRAR